MIKFNCPHCQQSLRVPVSRADTEAICPGCHAQLRVPPAVAAVESEALTAPPVVSDSSEIQAPPVLSENEESGLESANVNLPSDFEDKLKSTQQSRNEDDSLLPGERSIQDSEPVADVPVGDREGTAQAEILKDRRQMVEVSSKVFDDLADRVSEDMATDSQRSAHRRVHGHLGVARSTLYLFAALILFVALTSFWLGTMMNPQSNAPLDLEVAGANEYVNFEGRVTFRTADDPEAIDVGALVILLPEDSLPSEKFVEDGIAAGVEVDNGRPSVQEIRRLGGEITTADSDGRFVMKVAAGNRYYLLVVSALKSAEKDPAGEHLKELGNYFGSPERLLKRKFYRWSLEVVNTNRDIRIYHR